MFALLLVAKLVGYALSLPIILAALLYVDERLCRWRRLRAEQDVRASLRHWQSFLPPQQDDWSSRPR